MERFVALLGFAALLSPMAELLPACSSTDGPVVDGTCVGCDNTSIDGGAGGATGLDGGQTQAAGGLSTGPDPNNDKICNPGQVSPCTCLSCNAPTGTAFCTSDGKSFSECSCPTGC